MTNQRGLEAVVSNLRAERTKLASQLKGIDQALTLLGKMGSGNSGRRTLSLAARRKIAAAQRARWARVKKAA